MSGATIDVMIERMSAHAAPAPVRDALVVEEPLEIRVDASAGGRRVCRTISVTMRTPGQDEELAVGFLFTEGVIGERSEVEGLSCDDASGNVVVVRLSDDAHADLDPLTRHVYTTSSCGVCGKASIEALHTASRHPLRLGDPVIAADLVHRLPGRLREDQALFESTGGLHASALFDAEGRLRCMREDVGRHNALDKVIGAELLGGGLPADDSVLVVSGRAGFELVQKAAMAGIPILVAVGAPSSLAVQLATCVGMTLIGFVREGRFNVYAGGERVRAQTGAEPEKRAWAANGRRPVEQRFVKPLEKG